MNFHHYIVAMVAACPFMLSASATGLTTHHVGSDNTLVSIAPECAAAHKYLLLPVEESVDDARVNVLLDGKPETTFYVRLARNKIDYYVPFDLSRYPGKNIVLDVTTAQSRSTVREAAQDVCWRTLELSDTFSTVNREKYRPAYHHTPLYGWMNDPNGMFYKDGKWHLYYQYNPYGSKWQNMSWGHSVSTDLVNWEHLPVALEPDGLGTIFSGSCVVDTAATAGQGKDAVIALYTSAGRNQMQSMASSTDGGTSFVPFPANPVLTLETEARDPNMFWNPEIGKWNMVLAHPLEKEILIFSSPDLKEWTLESAFGKGLGNQQGVWECPDLIKLTIPGTDKSKWVMICNINPGNPMGGSGIQYFVGDFDGVTFTPDTDAEGCVPTKWLDGGKDNYALVTWSGAPDGRCVSIGWMSNWQYAAEVPTTQFRSANTLPRELSLFAADDNQFYVASLPSPEVDALRGHKTSSLKAKALSTKALNVTLPEGNDGVCEILADVDALKSAGTVFTLSNHIGEKVVITVDVANHTISFDRSHSGVTDFSHDFPAVITSPIHFSDRAFTLRIFVDRSSIEVFDGQGRYVVTNLVFPTSPYTSLGISALDGKAKLNSLDIYSLKALY